MTAGEATAVVSIISAFVLVGWRLRGYEARQTATDEALVNHERICTERYLRIEQGHRDHIARSDERHEENKERLDEIREDVKALLRSRRGD